MLDSKFSSSKIMKMYLQMIFYVWPLTIIAFVFFSTEVSLKNVVRGIFPFWGRALWFVSAYITLKNIRCQAPMVGSFR